MTLSSRLIKTFVMLIREILHFNSKISKQRVKCAFQKMFKTSRPPSLHPHTYRRYWNFSGGGGVEGSQRPKHLKKCSISIGISRGVGGSWKKKTFRGRGMDIFLNYTIVFHALIPLLAKKKGTLDRFVKTAPTNTRFRASE